MRGYTTQDVAELLGMPVARVQAYVRAGILSPPRGSRGEYRFSFQDISILRTAKELETARIKPRKVRSALQKLREQLPTEQPLTAVRISADGDRVVVRDDGTVWNPESEQVQLDFARSATSTNVAPLTSKKAIELGETEDDQDAEAWYNLGFDLESVAPAQAQEAYRRAIALDPTNADAHVNLGRLLYEQGDLTEAESHYRQALARVPGHPTAAFNLGIALDDLGRKDEAVQSYKLAITVDPDYADAHYNLARLYEKRGKRTAALQHLKTYRKLIDRG